MHNDSLDELYLDPVTKGAIGILGLGVAVLGVAQSVVFFLGWHARRHR